tara:strand:- start:730 stop:1839 length:1110 start_codon:yes stop_codon:yes gene_type:complete
MSYIKFNFASYPRSIAFGVEFENTTFSAPISDWSWIRQGDYLSTSISSFDPLFQEWIDRDVSYYGDYIFTDDGFLVERDSRINTARFQDSYGVFEISFDTPLTWQELDESGIKERIYASNNVVVGTVNDDLIVGDRGDDVLAGSAGNDIIKGEQGQDIAVFAGIKQGYSLQLSSQYQLIVSDVDNSDQDYGVDKLTGIEVVVFNDEYFSMSDLRLEALLNSPGSVSRYVNRLFNSSTGKHLFSAIQSEIDYLVGGDDGWSNEGISYAAPQSPTAEVYRFFVSSESRHFYTATQSERDIIISQMSDFVYEGVAYSAYSVDDDPLGKVPVIRYFNPLIKTHLYSTSLEEQNILDRDLNWINEGLAWYGDPV